MSKAGGGAKDGKETLGSRLTRLLQDAKAEHARAIADLESRFIVIEQRNLLDAEMLKEQASFQFEHGESLSGLQDNLQKLSASVERHYGAFDARIGHLEHSLSRPGRPFRTTTPFSRNESQNSMETTMEDRITTTATTDTYTEPHLEDWRHLSWSAIIFGTLAALAISIMLHVLGLGVTASSVDTNSRASDAFSTIGGVTGVWFLASTGISLFIGGFIASTLAHTFTGKRAAIYGIGVWALSTLITMSVVVPALVKGAGNAITAGGTVADRAGRALGGMGGAAVSAGQDAPSALLENLQRSLIGTPSGQVDQAAVQDVTRLLGQRFTQGELTSQQRDQLVNDVAKIANIAPDDARRRVDEAQNTIAYTIEQAQQKLRQAAEATRQAVSTASYSAFVAMLVGLLASLFGSRYGEMDEEHLPAFARIRFKRHEI